MYGCLRHHSEREEEEAFFLSLLANWRWANVQNLELLRGGDDILWIKANLKAKYFYAREKNKNIAKSHQSKKPNPDHNIKLTPHFADVPIVPTTDSLQQLLRHYNALAGQLADLQKDDNVILNLNEVAGTSTSTISTFGTSSKATTPGISPNPPSLRRLSSLGSRGELRAVGIRWSQFIGEQTTITDSFASVTISDVGSFKSDNDACSMCKDVRGKGSCKGGYMYISRA